MYIAKYILFELDDFTQNTAEGVIWFFFGWFVYSSAVI